MLFPVTPVAGQAWQACYQNPTPCEFPPPGNPAVHLEIIAASNQIDLKTQWLNIPFSPCPDTSYRTANMPLIANSGVIKIRLFKRSASDVANLSFFPFVQTYEQNIQVLAPGTSVGVPSLDWRGMLAMMALMIGVVAVRRKG